MKEENPLRCQHQNGYVYVIEQACKEYGILRRELVLSIPLESDEEQELEATGAMRFTCSECLVDAFYPDWQTAPGWLLPYFRQAALAYGLIDEHEHDTKKGA